MENKTRVLMQLRDCISGYTGITQETQLLFASFLDSSVIRAYGLMVKDGPTNLRPLARGLRRNQLGSFLPQHQKIKCLSDFIISYQSNSVPNQLTPPIWDLFFLPFRLLYLNSLTSVGYSIPVDHFDGQGFEHFLWDYFFSTILSADEFKKVTSALFRTIRYPVNLMQLAGRFALSYPKLDTRGYDIFLAQTPYPARVAKETQLVIRYHDAIPLFAPHVVQQPKFHQMFHFNALKLNAKQGLFACVSHAARNDLLEVFPYIERRAVVIHDVVSDAYFEENTNQYSLVDILVSRAVLGDKNALFLEDKPSFPYLLMVSRIEPRKNHARLIQAWERVRLSVRSNLKLIFVGKIDCDPTLVSAMRLWRERGELFHLQNVQVSELRFLYKEAACVVCPSLMEGFDLSGIEAMLSGGKVAASNIVVHREVYGDAAVYFDPYSVEEQAAAIESIVLPENAAFAKTIGARGTTWAKRYKRDAILPQWERFFERVRAGEFKVSKETVEGYQTRVPSENE